MLSLMSLYSQIFENSTIGTHVTTVSALSRSTLIYDITRGNEERCFFINHHTGVISTRRLLDFEVCWCPCFTRHILNLYYLPKLSINMIVLQHMEFYVNTFTHCMSLVLQQTTSYFLVVHALSMAGVEASTTVIVQVGDVNDSPPVFQQIRYQWGQKRRGLAVTCSSAVCWAVLSPDNISFSGVI